MQVIKFFKVAQVPPTFEPSAMYLVPNGLNGWLDIYVSNKDATSLLKVVSPQDVETIAQNKVTEILSQTTQVVTKVYQLEAVTELNITHNLNTQLYHLTVVDTDGNKVYGNDHPVDVNEFTLQFTEPVTGMLSVVYYVNT